MVNIIEGKSCAPFTVTASKEDNTATVLDAAGEPFCWVKVPDAIGGDMTAAKARAQRIAEALNRTEHTGE